MCSSGISRRSSCITISSNSKIATVVVLVEVVATAVVVIVK